MPFVSLRPALGARRSALDFRPAMALLLFFTAGPLSSGTLPVVHQQRYAMGTMFDIVVYDPSRAGAERAIRAAMDEIVRLDQVMSHFKTDSALAQLTRNGRHQTVSVDPSLYDVLQKSIAVSRLSQGTFDVTIAPLLRTWTRAREAGRSPSGDELAAAQRCVGYEAIDLGIPGRVRLRSDCLEIDLGGIGKGYAVDRALAILKGWGIRHATVNAGSSSIGSIGTPPDGSGWPVRLGADGSHSRTLSLRDTSMSTSQQNGEIVDPRSGRPMDSPLAVSVIGRSATLADALSTTLVLLSIDEGTRLLARFPGMSAVWTTPAGETRGVHGEVPWCP
jgi:thiamine biosynthesis lipoprotein